MNAASFLQSLFAENTTAVVNVPVADNPTAADARTSGPTATVETKVVTTNPTSNRTSGDAAENCDAVRSEGPQPCPFCGSTIFWWTPDGKLSCRGCTVKPDEAVKLIVVTLPDGRTAFEPFVRPQPNPFADWVQRPDVSGRLGWEPPDLPEAVRWWARIRI